MAANQERKIKTLLSLPIHLAHHCTAGAPLSLRCPSVVTPLLHRYRTAIVPLPLRRCCSVVALMSHRYHTTIVPLSLCCSHSCCRYTVAQLSHRYHSTVASAVDRKVHMFVASRGIIRVTVTIGECQARVSSSLEECLTSHNTVKVETY